MPDGFSLAPRCTRRPRRWLPYSPDLSRDRFHVWLSKYHWIPITAERLLLFAGGWLWGGLVNGIAMVLWGVLLRVTLGLHATWLVNSATHMWGSRRFETRDDSRNNWWVALLTGGEGWHNNHHAHPVSARTAWPGTRSTPTSGASGCFRKLASRKEDSGGQVRPQKSQAGRSSYRIRELTDEKAVFPPRDGRLFCRAEIDSKTGPVLPAEFNEMPPAGCLPSRYRRLAAIQSKLFSAA
jgi:hypothetical protein